ncbi:MAG TPA: hypothetical protein VEK57_26840 [Thermoanaerobaculia bacterium]|nr:hypothetical protein [Thermoanaerobaculia bacterium]
MPTLLAILLLTAFPSNTRTGWMRLESFRLAIGMPRAQAEQVLEKWNPKAGKDSNELVVDYADDKSMTLEFRKDRLTSVRFELFEYLGTTRLAFDEEKQHLAEARGKPRKATKNILIYDNALPNVMVVVTDDPESAQGKKGLGVLAVRYYDPRPLPRD